MPNLTGSFLFAIYNMQRHPVQAPSFGQMSEDHIRILRGYDVVLDEYECIECEIGHYTHKMYILDDSFVCLEP